MSTPPPRPQEVRPASHQHVGAASDTRTDLRWFLVLQFYGGIALLGTLEARAADSLLGHVVWLFLASTITQWMVWDASRRGKPILHIVQILVFLSWPFTIPLYLIKSRRILGVGLAIVNVIAAFGVIWASNYVTLLITSPPNFMPIVQ